MFYSTIFRLTILFPVFSCYSMDKALTKPTSEKMIFSLSIPKEVGQYFVPKVEKLKMPACSHARIVEMCNREKLSKKIDAQKRETTEIVKNNTELSQEIFELQRQKAELEKAILMKKIEYEKKTPELNKQKSAAVQQTKTTKAHTEKKQPDPSTPITIKDHRFALKSLMQEHKSKEQSDLFHKLWIICTDINYQKLSNNYDAGPYLNRKNHVLFGTVNSNFRYIYYPCTRKISILREAFSQLLTDIGKFMEKEKICSNTCAYYKSKNPELESISEDSSTDYSSHSSDMDTSSDHELMSD